VDGWRWEWKVEVDGEGRRGGKEEGKEGKKWEGGEAMAMVEVIRNRSLQQATGDGQSGRRCRCATM